MGDERELLERERRRHRMGDDAYQRLQERRDRRRRNRMITSGVLALVIAAAGVTGAVLAFRGTGATQRPGGQSTIPGETLTGGPPPSNETTVTIPSAVPGVPISSPIQFIDEKHGWWVGPNGEIMAQIGDGSPITQYAGPEKAKAIQFFDASDGWALTSVGGVLKTSDGGGHWTSLGTPSSPLSTFQFLAPPTGLGISPVPNGGSGLGHLMSTHDDGETWKPLSTPDLVESLCFVPQTNTGWVAAGATIYRTTNDTNTWTVTHLDVPQGEPWTATVRCASESDAWLLLTDGGAAGHIAHVLFHTSDGTTWTPVLQEAGTNPVGQRSDVYESNDPYPGQMVVTGPDSLAFVAWCPACGNSIDLLRTNDGGKTWDKLQIAAPNHGGVPQGVSFVDPDHGWVLFTVQTRPEAAVATISGTSVTTQSQKTVP